MRHRKTGRKLGRKSGPRLALRRSIVNSLFENGRIITTPAKARTFRVHAEKLITLARRGNAAKERGDHAAWLHAFRRAIAALGGTRYAEASARRLFGDIAPQFRDRNGGYTRILRHWKVRLGDSAPQVIFELVGYTAPSAEGAPGDAAAAPAAPAGDGGEARAGKGRKKKAAAAE
jgi:large subunit ribosomal protein L17